MTTRTPWRTPSASSAARCSAACGIHGSSAATTKQRDRHGTDAREGRGEEPLVARHVDEGHVTHAGEVRPAVAELGSTGRAAAPPRAGPGRCRSAPDQGGLAVVDVTGGRDDVHVSRPGPARCVPRRRRRRRRRPPGPRAGRAAAGRPRRGRPPAVVPCRGAPRGGRAGRRRRSPARRRVRRRRRRRPSTRPRAAGSPSDAAERSARASRSSGPARARPHRRRRPDQRRLERGQGQLVDAQGAGEGVAPQPLDELGVAEQQAALRAAEQLVAGGGDQVGAGAEGGRRVGLVGQPRVRRQQSGADVGHERDAERRRARRRRPRSVKPSTRKFDGCTLSTNAVCSPTTPR